MSAPAVAQEPGQEDSASSSPQRSSAESRSIASAASSRNAPSAESAPRLSRSSSEPSLASLSIDGSDPIDLFRRTLHDLAPQPSDSTAAGTAAASVTGTSAVGVGSDALPPLVMDAPRLSSHAVPKTHSARLESTIVVDSADAPEDSH